MLKLHEKLVDCNGTLGRRKYFVMGPYLNWSGLYSTHAIHDSSQYSHYDYGGRNSFDSLRDIFYECGNSFIDFNEIQWNTITKCKLLLIILIFKLSFILRFY